MLATSLQRGWVDDSVRRRLGIEPLTLDDDAVARIDALDDDPAVACAGRAANDGRRQGGLRTQLDRLRRTHDTAAGP